MLEKENRKLRRKLKPHRINPKQIKDKACQEKIFKDKRDSTKIC